MPAPVASLRPAHAARRAALTTGAVLALVVLLPGSASVAAGPPGVAPPAAAAAPCTAPPAGTTTLDPTVDTWVGSDATTANHGSETSLYSVTATPTKVSYLKFDLTGLAGRTLTGARLTVRTTSGSSSGSPSAQTVYTVADSSWSETTMTYANAPAPGTKVIGSVPGGSAARTAYTVTLTQADLQSAVGGQFTLAIKGAAADAFYVTSREATAGAKPQLVLTTG